MTRALIALSVLVILLAAYPVAAQAPVSGALATLAAATSEVQNE